MNLDLKIEELSANDAGFEYDETLIRALRNDCGKRGIVGQPRALSALQMGMSVNTKGYNIYISGEDGTGRHSAVRQIANMLENSSALSKKNTLRYDLIYACNFERKESPFLLCLPSSLGCTLNVGMQEIASLVEKNNWTTAISKYEELEKVLLCENIPEQNTCSQPKTEQNALGKESVCDPLLGIYLRQVKTALLHKKSEKSHFLVNPIHDSTTNKNRPLIEEYHPTHANMFGQIIKQDAPYHLCLSGGSLLDATGGFFVVRADKILSQNGQGQSLWDSLKLFAESSSFTIKADLSQEKILIRPIVSNLPVKIILIGNDTLYDKLCETDDEFLRLFKVSAEFDFSMPANEENIKGTIAYILDIIQENQLKPINDDAICELLRYSSWEAEMRGELTTKLSFLGDLVFEANYIAIKNNISSINATCIQEAMNDRDFVNGITEERINKEIEDGEMIISLEGSKVGVVNGLAVMDRGLASFGTPTVISVSVAPGSEGIVNIEHEAGLSGEIHDKGLLILEGYLRKQYARSFPLSIYAGICFEQSYAEVDGDSASSSELFALLSAIGELPVRQDIAVTGSVNQMGDIQPVGGINEKIEGFFSICEKMGLTGKQGVVIPKQNVKSLILPAKIVKAIEQKRFHIYPISSIDRGMEILTLRASGQRNTKGIFPPNTANRIIEDRLKRLYELSKPSA